MLKKILCGLISLSCLQAVAFQTPDRYAGMDVQNCHIHFEKPFGGNLLKKDMQGISPFLGIKLNEFFSIEGGYQYLNSSRANTLAEGDYFSGVCVYKILAPVTFKTKSTFRSPYVNLILNSEILSSIPVQFFSGIGFSQTTATFKRKTMQLDGAVGEQTRVMQASKFLTRFTLGANYFFTKDFAFRFSVVSMNTKKLHSFYTNPPAPMSFIHEIKPKNSICYSLGIRLGF